MNWLPARLGWRMVTSRRLSGKVTRTATAGTMIGAAAMMLVLSAFNGLESIILANFKQVHADLSILPEDGQHMVLTPELAELMAQDGIRRAEPVLEQQALVRAGDQEVLLTLVGVTDDYVTSPEARLWSDSLIQGYARESWSRTSFLPGRQAMQTLELSSRGRAQQVIAMWPKNPQELHEIPFVAQDAFVVQGHVDAQHALVPLATLQQLTNHDISEVKVWLDEDADVDHLSASFAGYEVRTPEEWEKSLFNVLRSERLVTLLILGFVVILASLGLYAATSLMSIERRKEAATLTSMGLSLRQLRQSYVWSGVWMGTIGGLGGMCLAGLLVLGQQQFGWLHLGVGYVVEAYPVDWQWGQIAIAVGFVALAGSLLARLASLRIQVDTSLLR